MKYKKTIPYKYVDFKWIENHYDLHRSGLCIFNNRLCYFKTIEGDWNEKGKYWEDSNCEIYSLNIFEKIKWKFIQKKFEAMIGYHWSYPSRKNGNRFYYRKPEWLYKWLFKVYYKK